MWMGGSSSAAAVLSPPSSPHDTHTHSLIWVSALLGNTHTQCVFLSSSQSSWIAAGDHKESFLRLVFLSLFKVKLVEPATAATFKEPPSHTILTEG